MTPRTSPHICSPSNDHDTTDEHGTGDEHGTWSGDDMVTSHLDAVGPDAVWSTAAATLQKVREDNAIPNGYGVRLFAATTPDGDVGLGVDFAAEPAPGDEVTEQHGTTLMVAPELSEQLRNQTLDVVPDPSMNGHGTPQLVLRPSDED